VFNNDLIISCDHKQLGQVERVAVRNDRSFRRSPLQLPDAWLIIQQAAP
jgi:hypothetical protein